MTEEGGATTGERGSGRTLVYCLVPSELGSKLHGLLAHHFADDPGIEVVVEQRGRERRSGGERRSTAVEVEAERRRIRGAGGRRVADRRAPQVSMVEPPGLPRRARRYADQLAFIERLEPSTIEEEDTDTARLVTRFQAGDRNAFTEIYTRYFDRVYRYLSVLLSSRDEAEDATQQVFVQVFEGLADYERRAQPFRAWLFTVIRYYALAQLRKTGRVDPVDPETLNVHRESRQLTEPEPDMGILGWITDRDLLVFVERLPLAQRQVLMLRYMLDLSHAQVATTLGRTESDVRALQSRAFQFLRRRLTAIGRVPSRGDRARSRQFTRQARVLRRRRFMLSGR